MRTGPVALAYLDDPVGLVEAAMSVSALTHYEDIAQEACAVWSLMIRHAVLNGDYARFDEIAEWVPNRDRWRKILSDAEAQGPAHFTQNSWSVGALQAAWSAIANAPLAATEYDCAQLVETLTAAIRIGGDTDTVAAIAGAMLGARWGMSAIPAEWRRLLHGWPGLKSRDLEELAFLAARRGEPGKYGWPLIDHIDYRPFEYGKPALARHPYDERVWLASASSLDALPDDVDAVVSLCLTGRRQVPKDVEFVNFRLMDESHPSENPNLDFVLWDAASTVAALRAEGKTVLIHCVASHSRTPAVGIAYSLLEGAPLNEAMRDVCGVLPAAHPNSGFRQALARIEAVVSGA
jgi:ADP-ribosyl-[dinitrogen reductase] hydrolase